MKILLDHMEVALDKNNLARYYLKSIEGKKINLNSWVGKKLTINFQGEKQCTECGKKVEEIFKNGTCERCFRTLPTCDLCMIKPELCRFNEGKCRDEGFAKEFCFKPFYIYFSVTNDLKVGYSAMPVRRWIDQGASQGILVAKFPNRREAGRFEYRLSRIMPDKTNWIRMLKGENKNIDLKKIKQDKLQGLSAEYKKYLAKEDTIKKIQYPILKYPKKIAPLDLDKTSFFEGTLNGIRGQYFIFEDKVFNVWKHAGFMVDFQAGLASKIKFETSSQERLF